MGDFFSLPIQPIIARGKHAELEEVADEIFMDMRDGAGTQHLAGTSYGAAVKECLRIGGDSYVLKVRPDMRGILYRQLKSHYITFRVYRCVSQPRNRYLMTDKIFIRFAAGYDLERKRSCLSRYIPGIADEEDLPDGVYRLTGRFSEDPVVVQNALELDPRILQAAHIVLAIPFSIDDLTRVNLPPLAPEGSHPPGTIRSD